MILTELCQHIAFVFAPYAQILHMLLSGDNVSLILFFVHMDEIHEMYVDLFFHNIHERA
jgi:hypothetical protein